MAHTECVLSFLALLVIIVKSRVRIDVEGVRNTRFAFLFLASWVDCILSSFRLVHRRSNLSGTLADVRVGEGAVAGL